VSYRQGNVDGFLKFRFLLSGTLDNTATLVLFKSVYARVGVFAEIGKYILAPAVFCGALYPKGGSMRRYEMIVILDPDLGEEGRGQIFDQIKEMIDQYNGRLVKFDEWGNRKLAYRIRKKPRGHYMRLDYCGTSELVNEMERRFKINDAYLKFMTVLLENEVDIEAIETEIAEEEEKAAALKEKARLAAEEAQAREESEAKAAAETTEPSSKLGVENPPSQNSESETPDVVETETVDASTDSSTPDDKE